jgi:hypothetical protein
MFLNKHTMPASTASGDARYLLTEQRIPTFPISHP